MDSLQDQIDELRRRIERMEDTNPMRTAFAHENGEVPVLKSPHTRPTTYRIEGTHE